MAAAGIAALAVGAYFTVFSTEKIVSLGGQDTMKLASGVLATILSGMPLVRRIFGVLVLLALMLAPVTAASTAGMSAGMSAHGMNEPMPDCNDSDGLMAACAQTMCVAFPGIVPGGSVPLLGTRLPFVAGPDESLAGISRLPDPKPPRTVVLG